MQLFDFRHQPLAIKAFFAACTLAAFGLFLHSQGANPFFCYKEMILSSLGNTYGLGEVAIKATPFILTALATSLPARVGLINVGGEGQLAIGALFSTWVGVSYLQNMPSIIGIPVLMLAGALGGALWAGIPGILRVKAKMNETITTLLLNYVAFYLVSYFLFGLLKDPASFNWPFSRSLADSLRLPVLEGTRINIGIIIAITAAFSVWYVTMRTKLGFHLRVVGGNPRAARHSGIHVERVQLLTLICGGAIGGLAGMVEVSGIEGHLRPMTGVGYGYTGFLVAWMVGNHPLWVIPSGLFLSSITIGGIALEMHSGLKSSIVYILMSLLLIVVLAMEKLRSVKS